MMFILPFLAAQAANAAAPATPPPAPAVGDWAALDPIPYRQPPRITQAMDAFVANEVGLGRCKIARPADGHYVVTLDLVVQVTGDGVVRRIPIALRLGSSLIPSVAAETLRVLHKQPAITVTTDARDPLSLLRGVGIAALETAPGWVPAAPDGTVAKPFVGPISGDALKAAIDDAK